jgi:hypothetical protein
VKKISFPSPDPVWSSGEGGRSPWLPGSSNLHGARLERSGLIAGRSYDR